MTVKNRYLDIVLFKIPYPILCGLLLSLCIIDAAQSKPPTHIRSTHESLSDHFGRLQGIALNPQQHWLYVIDRHDHQVKLLNSENLAFIKAFGGKKLRFPQDITLAPNQILLVADGKQGTIVKWDVSHLIPRYLSTTRFRKKSIHAIAAIDEQSYVLLDSYRNRLSLVQKDKILWEIGSIGNGKQQFRLPKDVFYKNGKIYVADTGNRRILVFDKNLKHLFTLNKQSAFPFLKPNALTVDDQGFLFVADEARHKVWIFDQNYHYLTHISYLPLLRRRLYRPSGVAANQGKIWISSDSQDGLYLFQLN